MVGLGWFWLNFCATWLIWNVLIVPVLLVLGQGAKVIFLLHCLTYIARIDMLLLLGGQIDGAGAICDCSVSFRADRYRRHLGDTLLVSMSSATARWSAEHFSYFLSERATLAATFIHTIP